MHLISGLAWATECTDIDLRKHFGPPRRQGNVGWCYANAAADMISYHYRNELSQPASAVDIALSFNYHWTAQNFREGGFMFLALDHAMRVGVCPIFYDQELFAKGVKTTLREKINFMFDLKKRLDAGEVDFVRQEIQRSQAAGSLLKHAQAFDIMTIMSLANENNFLGKLSNLFCSQHRHRFSKMANVEWSSLYTGSTRSRLLSRVNSALHENRPAGIAYYAGFFESDTVPKNNENRHMSVVVGRRYNKKTLSCDYLIRNSYGESCSTYTNPRLKDQCESGNIWVDEVTLKSNLYGVTYLKD